MCRASIAGHSISLPFFNTSAICLLKSEKTNEKRKKKFFKNFRGLKFREIGHILVNK